MNRRILPHLMLLTGLAALPALAGGEWYDAYDKGVRACDAGDFGSCENHMKQAVGMKPNSEPNARTYGMEFKHYTPYYYLGLVANNRGDNAKASQYFEKEANFGVIYKTPNSGAFVMMRKQLQNMVAAAPPAEDPAKKEAERVAAEKAAAEKKLLEERLAQAEADKKRLAEEAAAAKNTQVANVKPPVVPVARPTAPVVAPQPPPVEIVALTSTTAEGILEATRMAVKQILKGDITSGVANLKNKDVAKFHDKNAGYHMLMAYSYFLLSYSQPDRKSTFDEEARKKVQTVININSNLAPDEKLFSPKFIKFFNDNKI